MDPYVMRSLREEELESWFQHVSEVFAFKGTPRTYFERHWHCDPWRDLRHIRCLFLPGTPEILASTLRIFVRKMRLQDRTVTIGGIGEVSTKKACEGRGYAKALLSATTAIGQFGDEQIDLFLLHTRTAIPFYRSLGWASLRTTRFAVSLSTPDWRAYLSKHGPSSKQGDGAIALVNFDAPEEVQALSRLHSGATGAQSGPLVRDHPDYWRQWIRAESSSQNGRLPVAYVLRGEGGSAQGYAVIEPPKLAAAGSSWAQVVVKEFFVAGSEGEECEGVLGRLLAHAWEAGQWGQLAVMAEGQQGVEVSLNVPRESVGRLFPGRAFREVVDLGFMFKLPPASPLSSMSLESVPFVFYDCDGF